MVYLFTGKNFTEKIKAREELLKKLEKDGASVSLIPISDTDFSDEKISDIAGSASLFGEKIVVWLEGILQNASTQELVFSRLPVLSQSINVFIFSEPATTKVVESAFKKSGSEIKTFPLTSGKKENFNVFLITFPIERRDKKTAWIILQKIFKNGVEPEALAGIIFWEIKTMLAEKKFAKYKKEELEQLSSKIISLYHNAHRGLGDLNFGIEKMILEL